MGVTPKLRSTGSTMRPDSELLPPLPTLEFELQAPSASIFAQKYQLPGEAGLDAARRRWAQALAAGEPTDRDFWEEAFYRALHYAYGGGRILANIGADSLRPGASTINCTVSGTLQDSMQGIMAALGEAALTLKAGCGIGYDFTTLRPAGAPVAGAGATTSGPLPFMDIFDAACKTVSSAGGRRGAQMGVLDTCHPDIERFVVAKRQSGRLRAFNLSVLASADLARAAKAGEDWPLYFPAFPEEMSQPECEIIWRDWPAREPEYRVDAEGRVACRVYKRIPAMDLYNLIMRSTYDYNDPGFLLIDEVNRMNNLWFCEAVRASNPCGEQFLPPYGACLLGSINLAALVRSPFTADAHFDWDSYRQVVHLASRMLDNVADLHGLPLPQQAREIERKRRHGLGFMGLGSAMTMLGIPYSAAPAVNFTAEVSKTLALESWSAALNLAREKGPAPVMTEDFEITPQMLRQQPRLAEDGYSAGDVLPGRILHARYSRYMQRIAGEQPALVEALAETGARYSHATSIAPTGTMALTVGNNCSNGIEPSFAHAYKRNVIVPGRKTKEQIDTLSLELLAYRELIDPDVDLAKLPECFTGTTASEVSPRQHIDVMAAAQYWVDASISKTVNLPGDIGFDDLKNLYLYAIEQGLKGCTTFRFNPELYAGVLVTNEQVKSSEYEVTLADGSTQLIRGDDQVHYDGETHLGANLCDALMEGYYGRL